MLPHLAGALLLVGCLGSSYLVEPRPQPSCSERIDPALTASEAIGTLIALYKAIRVVPRWPGASGHGLWLHRFGTLAPRCHPCARSPLAHTEPNLVLYCAIVIVLIGSLGLFRPLWNRSSAGCFSIRAAGGDAAAEDRGVLGEPRGSAPPRRAQSGKLVEINLVLGIVKIALIVLAMVFSATPLPFESVSPRRSFSPGGGPASSCSTCWGQTSSTSRGWSSYVELWRAVETLAPAAK